MWRGTSTDILADISWIRCVFPCFITSSIPINQSIDTETYATGNFESEAYQKLVTFSTDQTNTKNRERPNAFITFDCDSIPERIEWQIFKRRDNGQTIQPMDRADAYNFITLKIEVYKEQQ